MEKTQKIFSIFVILAVVLAGGVVLWNQSSQDQQSLYVYCGAGLREPMEEVAQKFEEKHDIKVNFNFAGSNTLLSQIELNQEGDVYMPGAKYYIEQADKKGFIEKSELVIYHTPVITVPEGNPEDITSLEDLTNDGVKVVLGDPGACAIGRLSNKILEKNGIFNGTDENVVSRTATVNELVVYITQKQGEAAITWKADVHGLEEETDVVMIQEDKNLIKTCPIGSLTFSENKEAANKFVEFVSTNGKDIFEDYGFIEYAK
ncbi:MAG: ABC-type molybdate transport system, periplasmic component [Candidatus Methanohalarchaeum thermophilum]|uniref:ABC-type molybdate transport system, periplasmic component n=1 Tax=Methanohalarchaeum thermophilum TaxID=1903181 RepID=A0A1Q6DX64_METT1|nr:MAG: ABC-type molybdate transport system, periplasmic component [Candidatus Methanohalarchaeum thermophilum]